MTYPNFFLAVRYNFNSLHRLSRILTQSMTSVRLVSTQCPQDRQTRWEVELKKSHNRHAVQSDCNRRKQSYPNWRCVFVTATPIKSRKSPKTSFHALSHHYQLIALHIVAVCNELEMALLNNSEIWAVMPYTQIDSLGQTKSLINLIFSSSGYFTIRHQGTSLLDIRAPHY